MQRLQDKKMKRQKRKAFKLIEISFKCYFFQIYSSFHPNI